MFALVSRKLANRQFVAQAFLFRNVSSSYRNALPQQSFLPEHCKRASPLCLFKQQTCLQIKMTPITWQILRYSSNQSQRPNMSKIDAMMYCLSFLILWLGLSYAGVPLYKAFCRVSCKKNLKKITIVYIILVFFFKHK